MSTKRRPAGSASKATPARRAALALTSAVRERNVYLSTLAPEVFREFELEPSDKAFAHLLAQGVVSVQATLDELIDRSLRSPRDIKPDVRDALRIAAYEILYLHKEDHAAVDQGVELVRAIAPRATGVANYVLHRIVEDKAQFPFGDPTCSLEAAVRLYGFPDWLVRDLKKDLSARGARALMAESLEPAPVWFAPNVNLVSSDELAAHLRTTGIEYNTCKSLISVDRDASSDIFQLVERSDVGDPAFLELLAHEQIVVSDLSAQSIVSLAASVLPREGARVLEIGAGRGTKTVLLQSLCKAHDIVLDAYEVVEVKASKLKELESRIERAGGRLTASFVHDATKRFPHEDASFDLVFIDAPCTGVGTLRRHPEIKARLDKKDVRALARIGQAMIEQASSLVAPGGYLLYSTCTIFKEENDKVIKRFLASPQASCADGSFFTPLAIGAQGTAFFKTPIEPNGPDLHFAALLKKTSEESNLR